MAISNRPVRGATRPEVLQDQQSRASPGAPETSTSARLRGTASSARVSGFGTDPCCRCRRLAGWWGQSVQFWVLEFRLCASPTFNDTLPEVDTDGKLP